MKAVLTRLVRSVTPFGEVRRVGRLSPGFLGMSGEGEELGSGCGFVAHDAEHR